MQPTDWVRTGVPLREEDAEFLKKQIESEGYPVKFKHLRDAADGRNVVVLVQRLHLKYAQRIRRDNTSEGAAAGPARRGNLGLIGALTSVGGFAIGTPITWFVRGSALLAVLAGAGLAFFAFLVTLAVGGSMMGSPTARQQAPATSAQTAQTRRTGEKRDEQDKA